MANNLKLHIIEQDEQHMLIRWRDAEIILSVTTGTLQAAVMTPGNYQLASNQTDDALARTLAIICASGD